MGGEKGSLVLGWFAPLGSPPRGRGKGKISPPFDNPKRITPAWAGKRPARSNPANQNRDHPRVGGEKPKLKAMQTNATGSPPRGRGKGIQQNRHAAWLRITPAWAGKSDGRGGGQRSTQDHPRVGGEKSPKPPVDSSILGSPPRGRGKAYRAAGHCTRLGITPAWAGKSLTPPASS